MKMEWNDFEVSAPPKKASYLVSIPVDQSWGPPKNWLKVAEYDPSDKTWAYSDTYGPPVEVTNVSHWMGLPEEPSPALKMFQALNKYFKALPNDSEADDITWPKMYTGIDVFCTYRVNEAEGATNGNVILTLSEDKMANCIFYCHAVDNEYLTKMDFTFDKFVVAINKKEMTIWFGQNYIKLSPNEKVKEST